MRTGNISSVTAPLTLTFPSEIDLCQSTLGCYPSPPIYDGGKTVCSAFFIALKLVAEESRICPSLDIYSRDTLISSKPIRANRTQSIDIPFFHQHENIACKNRSSRDSKRSSIYCRTQQANFFGTSPRKSHFVHKVHSSCCDVRV